MTLLELESAAAAADLGDEESTLTVPAQFLPPEGGTIDIMRKRALAELRVGMAAAYYSLRSPDITGVVIDAEWGIGTRNGVLEPITDEEALALRLFMRSSDLDGIEAIAHAVFANDLTPELDMTQF